MRNIFGDAYFSDIRITVLNEEVNFTPKYGDFKVDLVDEAFSYINLNSEYTDVRLVFSELASYSLDIIYHPEAIVRYPVEGSTVEVVDETDDYIRIRGQVGESNQARVKITAPKKCIITLDKR